MSEQDDFLIGNNRLDESLLMDMSDMPVEQSAAKPAGRKKKSPAKRNTSSTVRKKNSATAKQSSGESSSRNDDGTSNRRNGMTPYRPIVKTSPPQRRLHVSTVNRWSRSM